MSVKVESDPAGCLFWIGLMLVLIGAIFWWGAPAAVIGGIAFIVLAVLVSH